MIHPRAARKQEPSKSLAEVIGKRPWEWNYLGHREGREERGAFCPVGWVGVSAAGSHCQRGYRRGYLLCEIKSARVGLAHIEVSDDNDYFY